MSTALLNSREETDEGTPPHPGLEETQRIEDTEAPWGRRVDGTPKAKPGAKSSGAPRKAAAPRPRKSATSSSSRAKQAGPDYRPALVALFSLPTFIANVAARGIKDEKARTAVQLDGLAFKVHGPNMAEALNETAKTQPGLARVLDKAVAAGPYGLLFGAAVPFVMQLLANHEAIPANEAMGILPADKLVAAAGDAWADA